MKETILLVSPTCPACDDLKQFLGKKGFLKKLKVIDVTTPEGKDMAKGLDVEGVPECVIVVTDGTKKTARVCTSDEWKGMLKGQ